MHAQGPHLTHVYTCTHTVHLSHTGIHVHAHGPLPMHVCIHAHTRNTSDTCVRVHTHVSHECARACTQPTSHMCVCMQSTSHTCVHMHTHSPLFTHVCTYTVDFSHVTDGNNMKLCFCSKIAQQASGWKSTKRSGFWTQTVEKSCIRHYPAFDHHKMRRE